MKCEICSAEVPPVVESSTMVDHYKAKHPNRLSEVEVQPDKSWPWGVTATTAAPMISTVAPAVPPATTTKDKPNPVWAKK